MTLKQKILVAFTSFVMLMIVLGVWVYIMIDNVQYKPASPMPVPEAVGKSSETKVSIEQKSQEEINKLLEQTQSSSQSSSK